MRKKSLTFGLGTGFAWLREMRMIRIPEINCILQLLHFATMRSFAAPKCKVESQYIFCACAKVQSRKSI
jgi:hypothetical protein